MTATGPPITSQVNDHDNVMEPYTASPARATVVQLTVSSVA
jgi:hypothetical protein